MTPHALALRAAPSSALRAALAALALVFAAPAGAQVGEVPATETPELPADEDGMPEVLPEGTVVSGTIQGFECGDNCYLTILTADGEEVTGLCSAEACTPWLENAEMPADLVGREVEATTGVGTQVDGSGTVMGEFTAFATLTVAE